MIRFFYKQQALPQKIGMFERWQAIRAFGVQIDNQGKRLWPGRGYLQDTHTARLDLPADGFGRIRHDAPCLKPETGAVIGDQPRAKRQKLQGKAGLSAPRCPPDQHRAARMRHAGGM